MSVTSGGTAPNGCSAGGSGSGSAGSAGIVMTLSAVHAASVAVPPPHRGRQVGGRDRRRRRTPRSPPGRATGRSSSDHLVLGAEVDALQVRARGEVPEVQGVAVLPAEQQLGDQAVLDHRRGAPLAGDQRVLVEVPPGVVGEVLRAAVGLPGAQDVERGVVEQGDPARAVRRRAARRGRSGRRRRVRSAACAGGSSRPSRPARAASMVLHQVRLARVGLRVVDVDVRAAQARHSR